jgi:integrase/recombinase XerD
MNVEVIITEFKQHLKVKGYAEQTLKAYRLNLDQFKRYLEKQEIQDLRKVNPAILREYQAQIMQEPWTLAGKAIKLRSVQRLFAWLSRGNRLLLDPAEDLQEPKTPHRKLGTVLTIQEMQTLLQQPDLRWPMQVRDRAVLEVFYSTAIRLDELLNLEIYHVDLKDQVLYIRKAKAKNQRVVPLGKTAAFYLKKYLMEVRPYFAKHNARERKLFLLQNGAPLTPDTVYIGLRQYRRKARIKKPVSPHTFRRTCATHLLQQGADIRYIQQLLGHKSLGTTQIYTKVMPMDIKETHEKTHPKIKA